MDLRGIEPRPSACKADVLPLSLEAHDCGLGGALFLRSLQAELPHRTARTRTGDAFLFREALYQLSYGTSNVHQPTQWGQTVQLNNSCLVNQKRFLQIGQETSYRPFEQRRWNRHHITRSPCFPW